MQKTRVATSRALDQDKAKIKVLAQDASKQENDMPLLVPLSHASMPCHLCR